MLHGIFHRNFRFHGGENLDFRGWHILVLPEEKRGSTTARADGLLNNPSITPHYLSQRAGTEPITSPTNELISPPPPTLPRRLSSSISLSRQLQYLLRDATSSTRLVHETTPPRIVGPIIANNNEVEKEEQCRSFISSIVSRSGVSKEFF